MEQSTTQTQEQSSTNSDGAAKLYAGKFKTIEELEKAYNSGSRVYQENQDLKKKLDEVQKAPEAYQIDDGLGIDDGVKDEVITLAKNSGLNQQQFNKLALELAAKRKAESEAAEKIKNELGTKYDLVTDYVKRNYNPKLADVVINNASRNKDLMEALMQEREQKLNSSIPGISSVGEAAKPISQEEINKLYYQVQRRPADSELRQRYLAALETKAKSRAK